MADIVNLRQARKRKARQERERTAEENRRLHGLSKADKARAASETASAVTFLDGHRRERPHDGDKTP